jgi:hypothetical protein
MYGIPPRFSGSRNTRNRLGSGIGEDLSHGLLDLFRRPIRMLVTDPRRFQVASGPIKSHGRLDLLFGGHLPEHLSLDVVMFFHLCDSGDYYMTILLFCMADGKVECERL